MDWKRVIRETMLPLALVCGVSAYLIYHFNPVLKPIGHVCHEIASRGQITLIGVMLFLQYIRISPSDLKLQKWHFAAVLTQLSLCAALVVAVMLCPDGDWKILLESALLCFACPTAAAAGVITERLGGNLAATVTYVVLISAVATLLIPAMVPLIHPSEKFSFLSYVWRLILKIFPLLILPALLAFAIRRFTPGLHKAIYKISHLSFYIWGVSLSLGMVLATRALVLSHASALLICGIGLVTVACCAAQYAAGKAIGARLGEGRSSSITAGQSLGQKNTGLVIWLGYNFMTPISSVGGGLYAIVQNIYNSWEIYRKDSSI